MQKVHESNLWVRHDSGGVHAMCSRDVPGGFTHHMTGYAPVSKKSIERVSFSDIGVNDVFL